MIPHIYQEESFYCVEGKQKLIDIICCDYHSMLKFSQAYTFKVPSSKAYT